MRNDSKIFRVFDNDRSILSGVELSEHQSHGLTVRKFDENVVLKNDRNGDANGEFPSRLKNTAAD